MGLLIIPSIYLRSNSSFFLALAASRGWPDLKPSFHFHFFGCKILTNEKILDPEKMFNLFSSGYSDGLITFAMDDVTGKINPVGHSPIRENTSFAVVDNDHTAAYFVHEVDNFERSGAISRWKFQSESGFESAEEVSSLGNGTCHITIMIQVCLFLKNIKQSVWQWKEIAKKYSFGLVYASLQVHSNYATSCDKCVYCK